MSGGIPEVSNECEDWLLGSTLFDCGMNGRAAGGGREGGKGSAEGYGWKPGGSAASGAPASDIGAGEEYIALA